VSVDDEDRPLILLLLLFDIFLSSSQKSKSAGHERNERNNLNARLLPSYLHFPLSVLKLFSSGDMATSTKKLVAKANAVSSALDELEAKLEPLLAQPLSETLGSLDTLQQAKLNVLLPYLINDLIFIYLRCRGVDPKTHPVVAELERVRQYFTKIKDAEESGSKKHPGIDKAAAGRFIKHAIAQAKQSTTSTPNDEDRQEGPSSSADVPIRITEKMRQREQFLKEIRDRESDEDAVLEIIDNVEDEDEGDILPAKSHPTDLPSQGSRGAKKRRLPVDPFTGAVDESSSTAPSTKKSKKIAQLIGKDTPTSSRASSVSLGTQDSDSTPSDRKKKKKKRKSVMNANG